MFLNTFVNTEREQIIQKGQLRQLDYFLNMLSDVQIGKGNYFDKLYHSELVVKRGIENYPDMILLEFHHLKC